MAMMQECANGRAVSKHFHGLLVRHVRGNVRILIIEV